MIRAIRLRCPWCGEWLSLSVDGSVEFQEYIEDCRVCCRPINLSVHADADGSVSVASQRDDD